MLIHEAFHNQTQVGVPCISLVLTLAVKEMLYLKIQTIIPHDPYICQYIYSNWKSFPNIQQNSSDNLLAVKRPNHPLQRKMYNCTIVENAQFIFLWRLQVKVVPSYPMDVALQLHFDV